MKDVPHYLTSYQKKGVLILNPKTYSFNQFKKMKHILLNHVLIVVSYILIEVF